MSLLHFAVVAFLFLGLASAVPAALPPAEIGDASDLPRPSQPPPFKIGTEAVAPRRKRPVPPPDRPSDDANAKKHRSSKMSTGPKVKASHILIKHGGSRRKASWKDPDGRTISATTRAAAAEQLSAFREDIVAGKVKFEDVAAEHSHCSSAKRGGDLGSFGPRQMQKPFEEAAFALKVGEISEIVDTDSGVHIILRTA